MPAQPRLPQQDNGIDCGVFHLGYAEWTSLGLEDFLPAANGLSGCLLIRIGSNGVVSIWVLGYTSDPFTPCPQPDDDNLRTAARITVYPPSLRVQSTAYGIDSIPFSINFAGVGTVNYSGHDVMVSVSGNVITLVGNGETITVAVTTWTRVPYPFPSVDSSDLQAYLLWTTQATRGRRLAVDDQADTRATGTRQLASFSVCYMAVQKPGGTFDLYAGGFGGGSSPNPLPSDAAAFSVPVAGASAPGPSTSSSVGPIVGGVVGGVAALAAVAAAAFVFVIKPHQRLAADAAVATAATVEQLRSGMKQQKEVEIASSTASASATASASVSAHSSVPEADAAPSASAAEICLNTKGSEAQAVTVAPQPSTIYPNVPAAQLSAAAVPAPGAALALPAPGSALVSTPAPAAGIAAPTVAAHAPTSSTVTVPASAQLAGAELQEFQEFMRLQAAASSAAKTI